MTTSPTKQSMSHLIRGGQVTLHQLRMFNQIISRVFGYSLAGVLLIDGLWLYTHIDPYQWSVLFDYYWAQLMVSIDPQSTQLFEFPNHTLGKVLNHQLLSSHYIITHVDALFHTITQCLMVSGVIYLSLAALLSLWLIRKGKAQTQETPKKEKLVTPKQFIKRLKKDRQASDIKLGQLPIIKNSECSHFFIHGSTGTGKSQLFYQLLDQIRERGDRAIIYDKGCQFVKHFYRDGKDVLLNPLDARCQPWNLWSECHEKADYERIAQAMIPRSQSHGDPFWITAARTLFASCAEKLHQENRLSHETLLHYCASADLDELHAYLQDTPAASVTSPDSEKMAVSVRSVAATAMQSLAYLSNQPQPTDASRPFSIREWLSDDQRGADSQLFIASTTQHHTAISPLLSTWLDIAIHAILSLAEDPTRRIWILMDELPTLHQLPSLQSALAEGRKYGACIVLGIQSNSQLVSTYGPHDAETIRGVTNTAVFLRASSSQTAKWVSKELGEIDIEQVNQGMSYGANTMRDGMSINRHTQTKPIVTPEQIMTLPNLSGYLSVSSQYPITTIILPYHARETIAVPFDRVEGGNRQHTFEEVLPSDTDVSDPTENKRDSQGPDRQHPHSSLIDEFKELA